jgi:hypothetical protein
MKSSPRRRRAHQSSASSKGCVESNARDGRRELKSLVRRRWAFLWRRASSSLWGCLPERAIRSGWTCPCSVRDSGISSGSGRWRECSRRAISDGPIYRRHSAGNRLTREAEGGSPVCVRRGQQLAAERRRAETAPGGEGEPIASLLSTARKLVARRTRVAATRDHTIPRDAEFSAHRAQVARRAPPPRRAEPEPFTVSDARALSWRSTRVTWRFRLEEPWSPEPRASDRDRVARSSSHQSLRTGGAPVACSP